MKKLFVFWCMATAAAAIKSPGYFDVDVMSRSKLSPVFYSSPQSITHFCESIYDLESRRPLVHTFGAKVWRGLFRRRRLESRCLAFMLRLIF
jgi:hypothetical protein